MNIHQLFFKCYTYIYIYIFIYCCNICSTWTHPMANPFLWNRDVFSEKSRSIKAVGGQCLDSHQQSFQCEGWACLSDQLLSYAWEDLYTQYPNDPFGRREGSSCSSCGDSIFMCFLYGFSGFCFHFWPWLNSYLLIGDLTEGKQQLWDSFCLPTKKTREQNSNTPLNLGQFVASSAALI